MDTKWMVDCVFEFPYYCQYRDAPASYGFICNDPKVNSDANLPIKYKSMIGSFSLLVIQYMMQSSLPKEATKILHSFGNDGYQALCQIHLQLNPKLLWYLIDVCHATP